MADHDAAVPERDESIGKLSMTTMDGERDSSALPHREPAPEQAPEDDDTNQTDADATSEDNQAAEDAAVVELETTSAVGDVAVEAQDTITVEATTTAAAVAEDVAIDEPAVGDDAVTTVAQEHAAVRSSDSDIDIDDLEELSTDVAASSASTATDTESVPESIAEGSTTTTTTTTVTTTVATTKSSTAEEIEVDSASSTATADAAAPADEATTEPTEDVHQTVGRRMTYIGEGLLDIGGMDAIDRLSDVTSYADLVGRSEVSAPPPPHLAINRLQAFLSMGSGQKPAAAAILSPAVAAPAPVAAPVPVAVSPPSRPPQAPVPAAVKTVAIENRKSKLLDFLANDVGERYLDGVYQDETRDAPDASSDEGDAHDDATSSRVQKTDAEVQQDRQRREQRANSKLLAFLAKERGERLHRVERSRSIDDAQRLSVSSDTAPSSERKPASQQLLSQSQGPAKTPSKLLEFVAKAVSDKPKLVIFNPKDAVSETEELEHLVAEEAMKKKQKREEREKARQKVMAFLAEETAPSSSSASASAAKPAGSTVKSVDETKVQREKVVDRYGREGLLDFLDRTESAQQQRIKWATARSASHGSSSPASSGSRSPKSPSQLTSPSATSVTASTTTRHELTAMPSPPAKAAAPAKSLMRTSSSNSTGNRLASFLSKITSKHPLAVSSSSSSSSGSSSSGSLTSSPVKTKKTSDMPPRHASQPRAAPVSVAAAAPVASDATVPPAPSTPEPRSTHGSANKMAPVLSALEQITQTCAANELSDVSIARISTLLTSISQIVKDDVARGGKPPVRRWSNASSTGAAASPSGAASPSWVKSGKEIEAFDKKHALVKSASAPPTPAKPDSSAPAVLERDSELKVTVAASVLESFSEFETAQNLLEVVATFHQLLTDCGLTDLKLEQPWAVYDHVKAAVASKLGFRQKQLFKLLDTKLAGDVYCTKPAARKRVCIIGAGPVGLRAAVEMALLGAQVVVLEKRKHFSRENILHLWPWVVQDLTSLGAKVLFPQFCHSTAYFHVGTRQLQCILLKVALLLGVTFFPATAFEGIAHPDSVDSDRRPFYTIVTKPQIPWMEFTAVLSASGTQDRLSEQARIKRFVFSRKEAIGLVCYFPNHNTTEEKNVAEFSWTIQFKQQMFAKMRDVGVDLENIVYYRGEMHYLVMTPKRQNLLDQGVMKHDYPNVSDLVQDSNIDKRVLHSYLKRVVDFVQIPQKADFARVRIFDFSARTRADKAASILTSKGKKLYVGLIGDSLMEPFWPEGLGTCRGFLSALDGCWMLARIGFSSDEQLLADRELAYRVVQHVSGFRRDDLQKNVRKYSVDPTTRYNVKFPQLC